MRVFKTIFATLFMLVVVVGCGYMLYYFHFVTYLPMWLNYVIRILCVVGVVADIVIYAIYLQALEAAAAEQEKKRYRDEPKEKVTR